MDFIETSAKEVTKMIEEISTVFLIRQLINIQVLLSWIYHLGKVIN